MSRRTASILAWGSCAISVVFVTLSIVVTARNAAVGRTPFGPDIALSVPATAGLGLVLLSFSVVGALIAVRRPDNGVGWLFCANGLADSFFNLAGSFEAHGLVTNPGTIPGAAWFGLASDAFWLPFIAMTTMFLFLLFPEGRPVGTGRRVAVQAGVIAVVVATIGGLLEPHLYGLAVANPISFRLSARASAAAIAPGYVVMLIVLMWSVWDLLRRLRRSTGEAQLQLRWFVYAALLVLVVFIPSTLLPSVGFWWQVLGALALVALPVSVGIAILKYHLYDIDVVINRTVVYVTLAAFITLVYVAVVVVLGGLIGAANESLGLSIVATAIVAVAFQPVRERVQRFANRFVYGERATPYEVLARFSERVAGTYATEDVLPRTARVIAEGTGAERAEVWLRIGEELVLGAAWPVDGNARRAVSLPPGSSLELEGADRTVPVRYHDELLGAIAVAKPAGESVSPAEDKLLLDLSSQAGVVLSNVRLTADLEARLDEIASQAAELRASRQRIVVAQDAERRRLERNIHDGAQQHLVALAVKLRLARGLIRTDPAHARAMLEELRGEIDLALDTLNALSLGIYPPLLEEQGIAAALAAQYLRTALPVHLDAEDLRRHPIEVEAAVYFCCLEALQNAAKYAHASAIRVELHEDDGALGFSIADDGVGFRSTAEGTGTGIQGMRDRIAVLGGDITIESSPGEGTTVRGRVPVTEMVAS